MARKGAKVLNETDRGPASSAWQSAVVRARTGDDNGELTADQADIWIHDEEPEPEPRTRARETTAAAPTTDTRRLRHTVPSPVTEELAGAAGVRQGAKLAERLAEASHAYDRDRYQDALRILRSLARSVPGSAAVRELYGLTLYRMGRWRAALKELDVYRALGGGYDQHPVMMDCHRALRSYRQADRLWEELRQASPSAEVVTEGRIVMAGALADRGDLPAATRLLERGANVHKPKEHHLRQWYALADLYERGGDVARARDLFGRIDATAPSSFDTAQRLRALR